MMDGKRKIALAAMTVAVAGLTGHVMQRVAPPDHPARDVVTTASIVEPAPDTPVGTPLESVDVAATPAPARDIAVVNAPALHGPAEPARPDIPAIAEATPEAPRAATMRAETETAGDSANATAGDSLPDLGALGPGELPHSPPSVPRMALTSTAPDVTATPDNAGAPLGAAARQAEDDGSCAPQFVLAPGPAATIDLALDVPCHGSERVIVRHGALSVTGLTSPEGALDMRLPAISVEAEVSVDVRGGPYLTQAISIPEARDYDRVIVQWQGNDSFQLNAYEFDAAPGSDGHVSAANPRTPDDAEQGRGGYLATLGDDRVTWPQMAEVYSFPAARMTRAGEVRFDVEAAVTAQTCGREMLGEAIQVSEGGSPRVTEITLPMPDCDLAGGFLVLKNLLSDLKIAGN